MRTTYILLICGLVLSSCGQSRKETLQKEVEAVANLQCGIEKLRPNVYKGDSKAIEAIEKLAFEKENLIKVMNEKYIDMKAEMDALLLKAQANCK